jgi:hypothetical protein
VRSGKERDGGVLALRDDRDARLRRFDLGRPSDRYDIDRQPARVP